MKAIIEIDMENEAFGAVSNPLVELGIILQTLGYEIEERDVLENIKIYDSNHEVCGTIKIEEGE